MSELSKFRLQFDASAGRNVTNDKQPPNLKGTYALASEAAKEIAFWVGTKGGSGKITFGSIQERIAAERDTSEATLPNGITLKAGQAVIFPDRTDPKKYYGWINEGQTGNVAARIAKFNLEEKFPNVLLGSVYIPKPKADGGLDAQHDTDLAADERARAFDLTESGYQDHGTPNGDQARTGAQDRVTPAANGDEPKV